MQQIKTFRGTISYPSPAIPGQIGKKRHLRGIITNWCLGLLTIGLIACERQQTVINAYVVGKEDCSNEYSRDNFRYTNYTASKYRIFLAKDAHMWIKQTNDSLEYESFIPGTITTVTFNY